MSRIDEDVQGQRVSWSAAMCRAASPARCGLCLVGLGLSVPVVGVALHLFGGAPEGLDSWGEQPGKMVQGVGQEWLGRGLGSALRCCLLLSAGLSVIWGPVGAWVARAEALRQCDAPEAARTTPSCLVRARAGALCGVVPMIVCMVGMIAGLGWLVGVLHYLPFVGPLLIAILIPVLLVIGLVTTMILVGLLSFSIMPAVIAVEGSDSFDAISRGYSYLLSRPGAFAGWSALSVAIASLPVVAVVGLIEAASGFMGPVARLCLTAGAAALGLSLFWTLHALVYLRLRRLVDATSENEIWDGVIEEKRSGAREGSKVKDETGASAEVKPAASAADEAPAAPEVLRPVCGELTLGDVFSAGTAMQPRRLVTLGLGVVWTALVMLGAGWLAWRLEGAAGPVTPEALWQAWVRLGVQRPIIQVGLAVGVLVLGCVGLARPLRSAARMAAVHIVFRRQVSLVTAWRVAGRTRARGIGSLVVLTAGIEAGLLGVYLLGLSWGGKISGWESAFYLVPAVMFVAGGAFGLGALAVEVRGQETTAFNISYWRNRLGLSSFRSWG